jgi:predicted PurR-regulated permease PerM
MPDNKLQNYFFAGLLLLIIGLTAWLYLPFLSIIVLSATLALVFSGLYKKILKLTGQESLSAFLSLIVVVVVVLTPLALFGLQIFKEAKDLYYQIANNPNSLNIIQQKIQILLPDFSFDFDILIKQILSVVASHLATIFSSLGQILISLILSLLTLFYCFRDGQKLEKSLGALSPLKNQHNNEIFSQLKMAVNSVVRGSLFGALLHGISGAALWGIAIFFFSLVPGIGLALILIPVSLFLFSTGNNMAAAGILIWGVAINLCIDYLITPQILKRGMHIHPLLVLFSVLGGLSAFGAIGILIGPLILSLLIVLLKIYPELISKTKV